MAYQPAEPAAFQAYVTTANLGIAGVYQSGVLDLQGFTQVDTHIMADQDGTITIRWYSDEAGTDQVRLLVIPYSASAGFQLFSAPAFTPWVQYEYTNGGVAQTDFFYETKFLHTSLSPQILGLTAFIAAGMVAQLNRSILVGTDVGGTYENVSVAPTTNSAGTFQNLQVVSGARPSQLPGRTPITVLADNETAPVLLYTVTGGKTLYITDIILTVVNSGAVTGLVEIYDALSATGTPKLPINCADPGSGGDDTLTTITHTFAEPLAFSTGVYFDEAASTLTMSGVMLGYEE